jgi:glycerol-3-phosphate acyltransferase PlsX
MDPRKANGGVFLGLNGVVIKSQGGADAERYAAAIDMGYDMIKYELLAKIGQSIAREMQALESAQTADAALVSGAAS